MKIYILAISILASSLTYGQTQEQSVDTEKNAVASKILNKLNINRLAEQQMTVVFSIVKKQLSLAVSEANIPILQRDKATKILEAEIDAIYLPMLDASKSIALSTYTTTFTLAELKEILAFYETPLGSKLATELPQLQAEAMKKADTEGKRLVHQAFCSAFLKFKSEGIDGGTPPFCM